MKQPECIAVKTITNTAALGIISINHTDDTVDVALMFGDTVEIKTKPLIHRYDENFADDDCVPVGFEFMGEFQNLDEFMRV